MKYLIAILLFVHPCLLLAQIFEVDGPMKLSPVDTIDLDGILLMQGPDGVIDGAAIDDLPFTSKIDSADWPKIDPSLVVSMGIGSSPVSIVLQGDYAYVVDRDSDDLKVIDVSNPSCPTLVGSLGIGSTPENVVVQGAYAYVVDAGSDDLKVIDVSNPTTPSIEGSLGMGSHPHFVDVQGDYAYVVDKDSDDLKVIDISNPASPSLVGSLGIGSDPEHIVLQGTYAYVVDHDSDDLKVIDINNPSSPTLVGSIGVGTYPSAAFVQGSYVYVTDWETNDLKIIDVSIPNNPTLAGSLGVNGTFTEFVVVKDGIAYVVIQGSDELVVIDVSNPSNPTRINSLIIGANPLSIAVRGAHAYVVDAGSEDLKVIRLGDFAISALNFLGEPIPVLFDDMRLWKKSQADIHYSNGNVGIGTMTPLKHLDIRGDMLLKTSNQGPRLHFAEADGNVISIHYNAAGDDLRFQVRSNNGNTYVDDLVRFESDGEIYFKDDSDLFDLDKLVGYNDLRLFGDDTQSEAIHIYSPSDIRMPGIPFGDFKTMQYDDTNGKLYYDNSSARYKENITDLNEDFMQILKANPKKYTRPGEHQRWEIGFIAEEMDELGLTPLVGYDEDGRPDDFNYRKMVVYLNEVNKTQQTEIERLKEKIDKFANDQQNLLKLVNFLVANSQ